MEVKRTPVKTGHVTTLIALPFILAGAIGYGAHAAKRMNTTGLPIRVNPAVITKTVKPPDVSLKQPYLTNPGNLDELSPINAGQLRKGIIYYPRGNEFIKFPLKERLMNPRDDLLRLLGRQGRDDFLKIIEKATAKIEKRAYSDFEFEEKIRISTNPLYKEAVENARTHPEIIKPELYPINKPEPIYHLFLAQEITEGNASKYLEDDEIVKVAGLISRINPQNLQEIERESLRKGAEKTRKNTQAIGAGLTFLAALSFMLRKNVKKEKN